MIGMFSETSPAWQLPSYRVARTDITVTPSRGALAVGKPTDARGSSVGYGVSVKRALPGYANSVRPRVIAD
jgi:hypothetical protein